MNPDPLPADLINFQTPADPRRSRLVLLLLLALLALAGCRGQGEFRTRPRDTTPVGDFLGLPVPVTLEELAANPLAYRGQYVRVTGLFTPPEEFGVCLRNVRGPAGRWYLANEDWRLAVNGYNAVAPRLQPGTPMTIDGIFTYYAGPLGCGKGATPDSVWYLAALHIESPNPLPLLARNGAGGGDLVFFNGTAPEAGGTMTATRAMTATAGTPLPTTDPAGTITPTMTATATATAPAGATTVTPTATPSPTATPAPGTTVPPVNSPTPTITPSPTPTGAVDGPTPTPVPPTPGSPPGGDYPPPPPTPTAAYP